MGFQPKWQDRAAVLGLYLLLIIPLWLCQLIFFFLPKTDGTRKLNAKAQLAITGIAMIPPPYAKDLRLARWEFETAMKVLGAQVKDVYSEGKLIQNRQGEPLRLRLYRPTLTEPGPLPMLVYFHGGGFVIGSLDSHDSVCAWLARESRCLVVSVDYRMAPEFPFPAAVEDSEDAYRWLVTHAVTIGADPKRVAVAGDSAGGNLAAVVSYLMAKAKSQKPMCQVLFYPCTDATMQTESKQAFSEGYFLTQSLMDWFMACYVPDPENLTDPRGNCLQHEPFDQLPPSLIQTAGFDPLRDEGKAYADRLAAAGVPVLYSEYSGMFHGFSSLNATLSDGARSLDEAATYLRTMFSIQRG